MKRYITTFVLFAYLLFNAGISFSMHFCGGKLTSSGFFASKIGCTCSSMKEEASDCCKDVVIKSAGDDQKAPSHFQIKIEKVLLAEIKFFSLIIKNILPNTLTFSLQDYHSPPFYKVPKFIFNQIFRL